MNFLVKIPQKIINVVTNCLKHTIKTIFNSVFGLITNVILIPLHFILSKTSSLLLGITKGIFKTVKYIVKKTNAQFLLLTPMGMYALGFLIGFIWTKVKKLFPHNITFSIDGLITFFKNILESIFDFYDTIKKSINEVIEQNPLLSDVKERLKKFRESWKENGFVGAIKETDLYKAIKESNLFKIAKKIYDITTSFITWVCDHPTISAFLFSLA